MWSLDEEMLSFIPQPVKAVLVLFPGRGKLLDMRTKEDGEEGNRFKGDVWYIKQKVGSLLITRLSINGTLPYPCPGG